MKECLLLQVVFYMNHLKYIIMAFEILWLIDSFDFQIKTLHIVVY